MRICGFARASMPLFARKEPLVHAACHSGQSRGKKETQVAQNKRQTRGEGDASEDASRPAISPSRLRVCIPQKEKRDEKDELYLVRGAKSRRQRRRRGDVRKNEASAK